MLENLTTPKKGLLIIAIPMVFQLVFIGILLRVQANAREAQTWAIHSAEVMTRIGSIVGDIVQMQNSVRGLILTGDSSFIAEYERNSARLFDSLGPLVAQVRDNPAQAGRVTEITGQCRGLSDWFLESIRIASSGRRGEAFRRAGDPELRDRLAALKSISDAFLADEETLGRERRAEVERVWGRLFWFLIASGLFTLAVGLGAVFLFSRTFAQRIAVLLENARRLGEGKPLHRPLGGSDEIGTLDEAFHRMARALGERERENEMFIYSGDRRSCETL